jgi:excinuclease ABC subunit A
MELAEGTRFQVLAPVVRGRKGEYAELFRELQTKGFARARVDGTVIMLSEPPKLAKYEKHDIEVVIDRLSVKASAKRRLTDSVETALNLASGIVVLDFVDLPEDDPHRERKYSERLACPNDHPLTIEDLEPRTFSFNSPYGACPTCTGLGVKLEADEELIVPDPTKSLAQGAVSVFFGQNGRDYFTRLMNALAEEMRFDVDTPWEELPAKVRNVVLRGYPKQIHVRYKNRYGRERAYYARFEGAIPHVERRHGEAESDTSRSGSKASCARCPVQPAKAPGSSPRRSPSASTAVRSPRWHDCRSETARSGSRS